MNGEKLHLNLAKGIDPSLPFHYHTSLGKNYSSVISTCKLVLTNAFMKMKCQASMQWRSQNIYDTWAKVTALEACRKILVLIKYS